METFESQVHLIGGFDDASSEVCIEILYFLKR